MRLAVLLHMFNLELLQEFQSYLANINLAGYHFDLYISIPTACSPLFIKGYWPDAIILPHSNRGMDIGGFFSLCPLLFKRHYDYVLKLHTKSDLQWRTALIHPVVGSPAAVKHCLSILSSQPLVGMVGAKQWLCNTTTNWGIYTHHLTNICKDWKQCGLPSECHFIGGTTFWIRYSVLKAVMGKVDLPSVLKSLNTADTLDWSWYLTHYPDLKAAGIDTEVKAVEHWQTHGRKEGRACNVLYGRQRGIPIHLDGMIEHAYERFFGLLVSSQGMGVKGV